MYGPSSVNHQNTSVGRIQGNQQTKSKKSQHEVMNNHEQPLNIQHVHLGQLGVACGHLEVVGPQDANPKPLPAPNNCWLTAATVGCSIRPDWGMPCSVGRYVAELNGRHLPLVIPNVTGSIAGALPPTTGYLKPAVELRRRIISRKTYHKPEFSEKRITHVIYLPYTAGYTPKKHWFGCNKMGYAELMTGCTQIAWAPYILSNMTKVYENLRPTRDKRKLAAR